MDICDDLRSLIVKCVASHEDAEVVRRLVSAYSAACDEDGMIPRNEEHALRAYREAYGHDAAERREITVPEGAERAPLHLLHTLAGHERLRDEGALRTLRLLMDDAAFVSDVDD